jgi:ABC-type phosphate/phosphonate transport system substrate-binding protein
MTRLHAQYPIRAVVLALAAVLACGAIEAADATGVRIRIGASRTLVNSDVNENDARAAIKTWADALSRETGMRLEYVPEVLSTPEQLLQRVRMGEVDVFSAPTSEYLQVAALTDPNLLIVDQTYIAGGEEYLLVVHAESGIRNVSELRGHTMTRFSGSGMSLGEEWLETLLAASNFGSPEKFFKQITPNTKASRAVLPVFFRQADACLVSRRAFETMGEMNPQVAAKLVVLAKSPKLVPVVIAIRKSCSAEQKEKFKSSMSSLGDTPAGRQILALFGSRKVMAAEASILASATDIVNASKRIRARASVDGR